MARKQPANEGKGAGARWPPFETEVLGVPVTVERIDLTTTDEIVAIWMPNSRRRWPATYKRVP